MSELKKKDLIEKRRERYQDYRDLLAPIDEQKKSNLPGDLMDLLRHPGPPATFGYISVVKKIIENTAGLSKIEQRKIGTDRLWAQLGEKFQKGNDDIYAKICFQIALLHNRHLANARIYLDMEHIDEEFDDKVEIEEESADKNVDFIYKDAESTEGRFPKNNPNIGKYQEYIKLAEEKKKRLKKIHKEYLPSNIPPGFSGKPSYKKK